MRQGFTLIETIVALVLLQFAILAFSGTIAVAGRDFTLARHAAAAHALARNRVAQLRANPCAPAGSGAATAGIMQEWWRVETQGPRRIITDSVQFPRSGGRVGVAIARGFTWCGS